MVDTFKMFQNIATRFLSLVRSCSISASRLLVTARYAIVSSANSGTVVSWWSLSGMSWMQNRNKQSPNMLPWGTPESASELYGFSPSIIILYIIFTT